MAPVAVSMIAYGAHQLQQSWHYDGFLYKWDILRQIPFVEQQSLLQWLMYKFKYIPKDHWGRTRGYDAENDPLAFDHNQQAADTHMYFSGVIMSAMACQITNLTIVYSTVYSEADQRKHQSSASLAFEGNSPVTGEFPAQRTSYAENVSISLRRDGTRSDTVNEINAHI